MPKQSKFNYLEIYIFLEMFIFSTVLIMTQNMKLFSGKKIKYLNKLGTFGSLCIEVERISFTINKEGTLPTS